MAELLSIGDFSRMTFLTVKALRHYHDVGLLEPAEIDAHSGYRHYRPDQVTTARLIRRFRDLEMPVDRVREVLRAPDEESRNRVIMAHLDAMNRQLQETMDTVDSLRRLLQGETELAITERDEPAVTVLAIREHVTGSEAIEWWLGAFTELHRAVRTAGTARTGPDGVVLPTEFFTEGAAELTAFVPVDGARVGTGRVQMIDLPATRMAVATHDGPMVDLDAAYSSVGRQLAELATGGGGPVRERYLPNGAEVDLLDHRTEVCWPLSG